MDLARGRKMKFEIISGEYDGSKKYDGCPPHSKNTMIKIDNKMINQVSDCYFSCRVDQIAHFGIATRGDSMQRKIIYFFKKMRWIILRWWNIW